MLELDKENFSSKLYKVVPCFLVCIIGLMRIDDSGIETKANKSTLLE